jgi:sigma-B regulation protein RsbU (phosphoserine phosphatase)
VFVLDADRFGVVIADVVDKGMPAALYMALTRSLLLAEARRERSPAVVLQRVHRLLLELTQPALFVTVFYGVLSARGLTYARAGHERPILFRDGADMTLQGNGTVLGLLELDAVQLEEKYVDLQPGDRLAFYTDGLVDAPAAGGESFGLGRLVQLLHDHSRTDLNETCEAVFTAVSAHQGAMEQYDDMTLLMVGVK